MKGPHLEFGHIRGIPQILTECMWNATCRRLYFRVSHYRPPTQCSVFLLLLCHIRAVLVHGAHTSHCWCIGFNCNVYPRTFLQDTDSSFFVEVYTRPRPVVTHQAAGQPWSVNHQPLAVPIHLVSYPPRHCQLAASRHRLARLLPSLGVPFCLPAPQLGRPEWWFLFTLYWCQPF